MTTEEKLQHFHDVCMEDAKMHYEKILTEYRAGLMASFEDHKADAVRRQEMRIAIETEKIEREEKKALSMDQIRLRRDVSGQQAVYRDRLFAEVKERLSAFRKTPAYRELLLAQVKQITELAGEHPSEIYVDAEDRELLSELPAGVRISDEEFLGGTMGVIPEMNIFVDNSFKTKLEQEKRTFSFITGGRNGEQ